jgi:hypothetical protein
MKIGYLYQVQEGLIPANHIAFNNFYASYYNWEDQEMCHGYFSQDWLEIHVYLIDPSTIITEKEIYEKHENSLHYRDGKGSSSLR